MSALHRGFALGQLRVRPIGSIQSKQTRPYLLLARIELPNFPSSLSAKVPRERRL
jgi:hypothetical protein